MGRPTMFVGEGGSAAVAFFNSMVWAGKIGLRLA